MMLDQVVKDKYFRLLKAYVARPQEEHLAAASELGRELVLGDVPLEEIAELHEEALHRLGQESPDITLLDTIRLVSAPLMELLMAYGLAFRERLEARERAEEALRESEKNFRNIFQFVPESLLAVNNQMEVLNSNRAFEELIGRYAPKLNMSGDELRGRILSELRRHFGKVKHGIIEIGRIPVRRNP